ncbi:hypothetical protein GF420_07930 [candidate division GN15 bacterium]|nr:hypothetical protein [candidate division GN15 bacterium]
MRTFRYSALLSAAATYLLIFIGGLVRVSGAGLGCPDWPKCFDRWVPPTSLEQLPAHIDPTEFNITLAWIEYGNRLVGVVVGLLIVVTAILAIRYFRDNPRVLWPSIGVAVLVAFQGWLGGVVVASELRPIIVTAHLLLAIAIALILLYAILQSYYAEREAMVTELVYPAAARRWIIGLGVLTFIQIVLGTQVRGQLEVIEKQVPLLSDLEWLSRVGVLQDAHLIVGVGTALFALFVGYSLIRLSDETAVLVKQAVWLMIGLIVLQLLVGFFFIAFGLSAIMQLFHLWFAALFFGVLLVLYSVVNHARELPARFQKSVGRVIITGLVIAAIMTAGGFAVIKEAELSRSNLPVIGTVQEFSLRTAEGETYSLEDMKGSVTLLSFMYAASPSAPGLEVKKAELYDRYDHSANLAFVTIVRELPHETAEITDYAGQLQVTDDRWHFLFGERDAINVLTREIYRLADREDIAGNNSYVLIDGMGRIRGFYRYDSDSDLRQLQQHVITLARKP